MNLSSILVFDSRSDYRSIIQQWIAGYWPECRVLHAGSLEEGMKAVENESIDIALIGMPDSGMDALAFSRMLKTKKTPPNFPLLLIASHPISSSFHADALEAGVNDCISQPIDQIDLIAKIKTMIRLKRLEDQLHQANDILGKLGDERLQHLRHSEIKYRALIDATQDCVWELNLEGVFVDMSPQIQTMLGYSAEEMIGTKPFDYAADEDRMRLHELFLSNLADPKPVRHFEFTAVHKNGHTVILDLNACPQFSSEGRLIGFLGMNRDISEQKRAEIRLYQNEKRLIESNQILTAVFEHTHAMAVFLDPQFNFIWVNRAYAETCGHEPSFFPGKNHFDLYPHEENLSIFQRVVDTGEPFFAVEKPFEFPDQPKRGVTYWDWSLIPVKDAMGNVTGLVFTLLDVTSRVHMTETIHLQSLVLDQIQDQITITDLNGVIMYINQEQVKKLGRTQQELVGQTTAVYGEDLNRGASQREILEKTLQDGRWRGEVVNYAADGREIILDCRTQVVRNPHGTPVALCGIATDITERKRYEKVLRESEENLQSLFDAIQETVFLMSRDGTLLFANKIFAERLGKTTTECIGRSVYDLIPREVAARRKQIIEWVLHHRQPLTFEDERQGRWLYHSINPVLDAQEKVERIAVFAIDITERKKAEDALRESEERLRLALLATNDVIWDWDIASDTQLWNAAGEVIFGWTDIVQEPQTADWWLERVHPDDRRRVHEGFFAAVDNPDLFRWEDEYQFLKTDGSYAQVLDRGFVLRDRQGKAIRMIGAMLNITERKKAEDALRENSMQLQTIAQAGDVGLWDWDLRTNKVYYSPQWKRQIGYEDTEISDSIEEWQSRVHPDDLNRATKTVWDYIKNPYPDYQIEFRFRHKDGSYRWILAQASLLFDDRGYPVRMLGVHLDITERKREERERENLQAQLLQAQKLEALGTLAGGIAHDFNNILAGMIGFTQLTMSLCEQETEKYENLKIVLQAAGRAKNLVEQILAFSRKNDMQKKPFQPSSLLKEGLKLMRSTLPSTIEIRQSIEETGLCILGDPSQIHQVLMNLCTNAAHAMREKGGVLSVGLREELLDSSIPILPIFECKPGRYLCLEVRDTGHGIDPSIHGRIFDPFFTTKEKTEGTGLGLSVVLGIIKSHNGAMAMESQVGQGTAFRIYLPTVEFSVDEPQDLSIDLRGQGERILLVDDEEVLIQAGSRILKSLGYEAIPCRDGLEALSVLRTDPSQIDLVLTDQTMPKLKGIELAKEIKALRPDIPILLCTGYDECLTPQHLSEAGICELLMKPFTAQELSITLRKYCKKRKEE